MFTRRICGVLLAVVFCITMAVTTDAPGSEGPRRVTSPITNRIGIVFIPVSDIARSAEWYGMILGRTPGATTHEGKICNIPMDGDVQLILDGHKLPPPRDVKRQTLFSFWTDDVRSARQFLLDRGAEVIQRGDRHRQRRLRDVQRPRW